MLNRKVLRHGGGGRYLPGYDKTQETVTKKRAGARFFVTFR